MSVNQLFILRCDYTWPDNALIHRCQKEVLGNDRENSIELRARALTYGWDTMHDRQLCPFHRLESFRVG